MRDRLQRGPIPQVEPVAEPISPTNSRPAVLPVAERNDDALALSFGALGDVRAPTPRCAMLTRSAQQARLRNLEILRTSSLEKQRTTYDLTVRNADMRTY